MIADADVRAVVLAQLSNATGRDVATITDEQRLGEDLFADELDLIETVLLIEESLDVELHDDAIAACRTVADLVALTTRALSPVRPAPAPAPEVSAAP